MIITGNVGWGICARGRVASVGERGREEEYGCGVKKV